MAWYSFPGPIPPKFEHKLRRHKQRFGKIATTVVLDKDENLLWSGLQRHRSCHSNEMTLLSILLAAVYLGTRNCTSKIIHGSFFLQQRPRRSWSLSEICKTVIEIVRSECGCSNYRLSQKTRSHHRDSKRSSLASYWGENCF